jgi:hypothetical protein
MKLCDSAFRATNVGWHVVPLGRPGVIDIEIQLDRIMIDAVENSQVLASIKIVFQRQHDSSILRARRSNLQSLDHLDSIESRSPCLLQVDAARPDADCWIRGWVFIFCNESRR